MLRWHPLFVVYALATLTAGAIAIVAWRRRSRGPAAVPFALVLAGLAEWSLALAVASLSTGLHPQQVLHLAIYPGVAAVVLGVWWVTRALVDRNYRLTGRTAALLLAEPAGLLVVIVTNPWHHQFFRHVHLDGPHALLNFAPGPLFWAHTAYSYLVLGAAALLTARAWRRARSLRRRQLGTFLLGMLVPVAGNAWWLMLMDGGRAGDLTPVFFIAAAPLQAWALFGLGLLRVVPVAREQVLDTIEDAVLVTDPAGQVLDINPAAEALLRAWRPDLPPRIAGLAVTEVFGAERAATWLRPGALSLPLPDGAVDLDVRVSELRDRRGAAIGRVLVARDVTVLHRQRRELEAANAALREHVDTIDQLRASLAEQAVRDPLTGLYNRRYLVEALGAQVARARARRTPLSVVLLDIDQFKSVNDAYGHATGDALLVAVAHTLAEHTRAGDTVARYGGEEFVVVLPGADPEQARERADACRAACSAVHVPAVSGPVGRTISAGVASLPPEGATPAALLAAADAALYAAKRAGRDRVCAHAVASG